QTMILLLEPLAQPLDLFDDRAGADLQSRQMGKQTRDLTQRQSIADPHHRRRRQGIESQLPVRQIRRRWLILAPRLHLLAAAGTPAAARVITSCYHTRRNQLFHQTRMLLYIRQLCAAVRTATLA